MSTMTVGDDGANEVETHSSSVNIRGDAGGHEEKRKGALLAKFGPR